MANNEYEFTEEENVVVGDLANKMKFVGIFEIILGVIQILGGIFGDKSGLVGGVVSIVVGIWTMNASKFFQKIVDTTGNDITNLMNAIRELLKLYKLQFWTTIISIVLILVLSLVLVVMGGAATN